MAKVTVENLYIPQGSTYTHDFFVIDGKTFATISLTDYTAISQFRSEVNSHTVLYTASTTNGDIVITPAEGKVTLTISPATSIAWNWTKAVYDIELVSPLGIVTRLVKGNVFVDPEVTRV